MKRFFLILAILHSSFFLISCAENSQGGYTLGQATSPAWHSTAPRKDKNEYFDKKSLVQLCNMWAENYPNGKTAWKSNREEIGLSLIRRGKSSMYCANPQGDEMSILQQQINIAKRDACNARKEAYRQCLKTTDSLYSWTCKKPKC